MELFRKLSPLFRKAREIRCAPETLALRGFYGLERSYFAYFAFFAP